MDLYRHTQIGYSVVSGLASAGIFVFILIGKLGMNPLLVVALVVMVLALALFYSLTVEVGNASLTFWFGPAVIRKTIQLGEIAGCETVRNPWYYGWGIRITPHGTLYNVSGSRAVEIKLKAGKKLRVGTDEPETLCAAIERARKGAAEPAAGSDHRL